MIIKIFENLHIKEVVPYFIFHHLKNNSHAHIRQRIPNCPLVLLIRGNDRIENIPLMGIYNGGGGGADNLLSILANLRM